MMRKVDRIGPLLLLLVYFALGLAQVTHASITFDEGPHLAIGYATLRTGDFRLQPVHIHPPLANVLAAAPLLLQDDLPDPRTVDGWEIASLSAITDAVVWQYPDPARIAVAGRVPILLVGVLLGALVYRWAAGGRDVRVPRGERLVRVPGGGLLALALYAFDPNMIAHGSLITTDMVAVFLIVATLYAVYRYQLSVISYQLSITGYRLPTVELLGLLAIGILLGLAQLAKVSTLLLVPVVGVLLLLRQGAGGRRQEAGGKNGEWRMENQRISESANPAFPPATLRDFASIPARCAPELRQYPASRFTHHVLRFTFYVLRSWAIVFLTAGLVVWAGYRFEVASVPGVPFPVPAATHVRIFQSLGEHYDLGHPTFLMGRVSDHGWWWYFPVAFALKTPLPTLVLLVWALTSAVLKIAPRTSPLANLAFWLFPTLYLAASLFSTVNIGYRHLLPVLPFLYIGIGRIGEWRMENGEWRVPQPLNHSIPLLRCGDYATQLPNHLTGFQHSLPLRSGTSPASRITHHASRFTHHVLRFTFYALRITFYALLVWLILGTFVLAPDYLTFFNALAGGPENGYRYLVDSNLDWGQNLWDLHRWMAEHGESHVAYAHYSPARPQVYGIDADFLPPDPRAVDFAPWNPASGLYAIGATVLQGPYTPDVNTYAWFRARDPVVRLGNALWLFRVPARDPVTWAAICANVPLPAETVRANLGRDDVRILRPDCAQAFVYPATGPGLIVAGPEDVSPPGSQRDFALRAPSGATTGVVYRAAGTPVPASAAGGEAAIDGPLDFLGYTLDAENVSPGDSIVFQTYWRVIDVPNRPLSLLAHLLGPDGTGVAVGDGLGFPIEQWQPGDVIVQRHVLPVLPDAPPGTYTVITGAYWLDTLERWPVTGSASPHADVLSVPVTLDAADGRP